MTIELTSLQLFYLIGAVFLSALTVLLIPTITQRSRPR